LCTKYTTEGKSIGSVCDHKGFCTCRDFPYIVYPNSFHYLIRIQLITMTSPQSMDELYWGKDHEDVNDWAKCLTMAAKVRDLNNDKLFKIAKLNLHDRTKEWFKKLNPHQQIGLS
jgi:hypothetical protein